ICLGFGLITLWIQRKLFSRTLGERIWGIKSFKARGTLERKNWHFSHPLQGLLGLGLSLGLSFQCLWQVAQFHPIFKPALDLRLPVFVPPAAQKSAEKSQWSLLPFYLTVGTYPRLWKGEPVWYELPYVKGPPERFPARVVVRLPVSETQIVIEGPRTPEELRGKRPAIKACLQAPSLRVRASLACLGLRQRLLERHTQEMRPGHAPAQQWDLLWFEVQNSEGQNLDDESRPMGVYLRASNAHHQMHRFVLISSEAQTQALTLELPASGQAPGLQPELEMMFKTLGSMSLHPTLAGSRSWADRRLSEIRLSEITQNPELEPLGELAALLIAKTTVSPRAPDAYYHLAGVSMLLLKKSAKTPAAELVSAIARPQVEASVKFMRDVAPQDPRNRPLERMLLEVKQFR
ncbi:MAG: hypothetical protein ACK5QT_02545, partial [Oligoflexia bacterium]